MPFSLSDVANDADLGLPCVVIVRSQGAFQLGGWNNNETRLVVNGVIGTAQANQLDQFPEGDRITGWLIYVSPVPVYPTSESRSGVSDKILWHGRLYRVKSVAPWPDFGFWLALVERMAGQ